MPQENVTYLGDGVYAEYDGLGVWLRTGDHRVTLCDEKIYLEPQVLEALSQFVKNLETMAQKEVQGNEKGL